MNTIKQLEDYKKFLISTNGNALRIKQAESLYKCLESNFNFDKIVCIETGASQNKEDGCFGFYLGKITQSSFGEFYSVDINENTVNKSKIFYKEFFSEFAITNVIDDSINFLINFDGSPNLVHLDSCDLDLKNPVSSMLHGWLEFKAIENKMPPGSIILIDDNYLKGTWVQWKHLNNGIVIGNEKIDITYDMVGKGSLVYHYCQNYDSNWNIVGDHYIVGDNIKLIIQKK